jgi:hypothetical protein
MLVLKQRPVDRAAPVALLLKVPVLTRMRKACNCRMSMKNNLNTNAAPIKYTWQLLHMADAQKNTLLTTQNLPTTTQLPVTNLCIKKEHVLVEHH